MTYDNYCESREEYIGQLKEYGYDVESMDVKQVRKNVQEKLIAEINEFIEDGTAIWRTNRKYSMVYEATLIEDGTKIFMYGHSDKVIYMSEIEVEKQADGTVKVK